jgi:hypothetical protein
MLGGVRFAHTHWNLPDVQDAATDRTIRYHQGSEHQCDLARPREPEAMYADNADRVSIMEQGVPSPDFRYEVGS